ncbi:MAG TPA: hypothetical protein VGQ35_21315 [Dongiaceae bacterium]|jgi:hypothetical protein|nr:hypothetical protein [Dongiaceae bacterium]
MPLEFEIEFEGEDEPVLTLPYERNFEDGRANRGFTDLRGRPELAAEIAEAVASPALKALLVALAEPASPFFSIGCDHRPWPPAEEGGAHQSAGYIQLIFSGLEREAVDHRRHLQFGRDLKMRLERAVGDESWVVKLIVAAVDATDIGGPEEVWSPVIEFCALGPTEYDASASAERLIGALRDFVSSEPPLR